uniref:Proton-coupled amino acid transporter 1 n=1 Tax=Anthurium amnicola TaxID=1678845 RepID=A0A1D1Y3T6_9ARAE
MAAPLLERRGGGATAAQTLGNVVVSIVGTGVLGLPYAFRVAGWAAGSLGVAAAGISTYYCMTLLIECRNRLEEEEGGERTQIHSYGDLGERGFGRRGRFLTELLVLVSQAGGSIAYLVFIGQNLSSVFSSSPHHPTIPPSTFVFLILLPLEAALSFIRSLSAIAPFSALADACNLLAMAIVLKDDFQVLGDLSRMGERAAFNGLWGLPYAGGVAVFCFEGFSMTLPLEASMADRDSFPWVLSRAFLGITLAYVCFGVFGYLAYGDGTRDIVTLNLPTDWSAAAVKVGLCVGLAFTFPVMMHPIHDIVETRLKASGWFQKVSRRWRGSECFVVHLARMLLVVLMAVLASLIPGFGSFVAFVGGTVCALLSFVLPATFHLKLMGSLLDFKHKALDYGILILGLAFAGYGTYTALSA